MVIDKEGNENIFIVRRLSRIRLELPWSCIRIIHASLASNRTPRVSRNISFLVSESLVDLTTTYHVGPLLILFVTLPGTLSICSRCSSSTSFHAFVFPDAVCGSFLESFLVDAPLLPTESRLIPSDTARYLHEFQRYGDCPWHYRSDQQVPFEFRRCGSRVGIESRRAYGLWITRSIGALNIKLCTSGYCGPMVVYDVLS